VEKGGKREKKGKRGMCLTRGGEKKEEIKTSGKRNEFLLFVQEKKGGKEKAFLLSPIQGKKRGRGKWDQKKGHSSCDEKGGKKGGKEGNLFFPSEREKG